MEDTNIPRRKMSVEGESLYKVLGLERGVSTDEIQRAYRTLALRYHPDKNPDDPVAAEKFKEINKANSVLSNENKRRIYDEHGFMGQYATQQLGEDNIDTCWFKALLWCIGCFGCCCSCCCLCCFCCCGKCCCKSSDDEDGPYPDSEELAAAIREHDAAAGPAIVIQPSSSDEVDSPGKVHLCSNNTLD